ncbi:MAG TPA: acyltransferase domain-containing protein, partial [Candidatus Poseidoniales archaeon]|nr:acyltransferase domain-containing protein [Candidatus Poseidoniales archaeon]
MRMVGVCMAKSKISNEIQGTSQGAFEPIAIIGLSCILPDSPDIETFWQNVLNAKVSISEIKTERWGNIADFYDSEGSPGSVKENMTYSKIGGFVEGFEFDWRRWRQPPGTLKQIDISQQWAVEASATAIEHAGYGDGGKELPNASTGVIFANALGGENRGYTTMLIHEKEAIRIAKESGMTDEAEFIRKWRDNRPVVNEDTMPGELANVVAGRVANLLDLQGPNYTTDAACATSMAALLDSCRQLQSRQVDVALCGASDRTMDPASYVKFSAIGALSATHSTPFDSGANGFVMGEGSGVMVLKRLSDAITDGDTIYSVVRGIGASSDGRGKGITAPSQRGQIQAVARAYSQSGYSATTVELVEAHGTSTKVGDATELATLSKFFAEVPSGENIAVGSIKSQIGHLKAAAGMAGMLKTTLALHHRTIPPSAGFSNPNDTVDWSQNPFFIPTIASEWPSPSSGTPRRAGVSAFGFGGTNFHVAMEAYDPEFHAELARIWNESKNAADAILSSAGAASASWKDNQLLANVPSILDTSASPSMTHEELRAIEGGILLLSAATIEELQAKLSVAGKEILSAGSNFDDDPRGQRLSIVLEEASKSFEITSVRLALIATSWADFEKRLALAEKALADPAKWGFLAAQGILVTNNPAFSNEAKVAHMYPGQGSQYVGMTYDLSMRYSPVVDVWTQADETMVDVLEGETLSSFVLRHELSTDEMKEAENKLKQTEYTQPAMLTSDLAIEKLLNAHGHSPDMVAGHSLGEYAALMSSGILAMDGALRAAAARGTEMGSVDIADTGLMASIAGPFDEISRIIAEVDGYVIAANKNSPKMTVIAGETEPVKQAIAKFDEAGMQSSILQTSHAFHSRIVEPANKPLRKFLEGLEINWPTIPISSNVDGGWYPMAAGGSDSKSAILEKLAPQMASAVEWTKQVESMYDAGARIFIEVGPKRALTMFATQILEKRTHLAIMSNHPKQGGIASFLQTLAMLSLAGRKTEWPAGKSSVLTEAFRAGPIEAHQLAKELGSAAGQANNLSASTSSADWEDLRTRSRPLPSAASLSTVDAEHSPPATTPAPQISPSSQATSIGYDRSPGPRKLFVTEDLEHVAIEEWIGEILSKLSGYPTNFCKGSIGLMAGLRLSKEQISQIINDIGSMTLTDSDYDVKNIQTAGDLARWVTRPPQGWVTNNPDSFVNPTIHTIASTTSTQSAPQVSSRSADPYVVTGISLGLPGGEKVFDDDNFEKLVRGETCITEVSDQKKQQILDKNIVRLIKGRDGQARMEPAENFSDLPQLAGQAAEFDIVEEFGIPAKVARAWDVTTRLAVASGLLALRDAGIPLTPEEKIGKGGLRLITNWRVPSVYRDRTGIIFACCFPGNASMAGLARREGDDGEGKFDRSYLFQVLPMGHSQFAQTTGIRGPNTTINNACASTAAAFSIAEDWLDVGKVDRVVIISGDDVTGDELWEWIGAGFAASGAASTGNSVEDVALPFDARRNGLVLGMGAASFVIEKKSGAAERGVQPYAELLGTRMANSAFHGTRLDVEHVSNTMNDFIGEMESKWKLSRKDIAPHTFFMSHETYTPARGGSAQAEVKSLRNAFGDSTDSIVITNTKGFTGHPMGVGIEDAVLIHALATGRAPPIANHKEVDSELGNLNLSKGGQFEGMKYGLRFAAGFGSQLVVTLWKASDVIGQRIDGAKLLQWNKNLAGTEELILRVLQNKLVAFINSDENLHGGLQGDVYEVTENLPLPKQQKDTVQAVEAIPTAPILPATPPMPEVKETPSDTAEALPASISEAIDIPAIVIDIVVKHTGYPADFIELDQDLEGELGIDTV